MRLLRAILPLMLTVFIVYWLNKPVGTNPALGALLDPVGGFWVSAEAVDKDFNTNLGFDNLSSNAEVWFDDRLVPHIKADNDYDLYFLQGYVHAYFRLWQMDLQTRAAAGRVCELLGDRALKYDREQRRKGMVYGAEKKLLAMEGDPRSKTALDAYRDGVNKYIATLDAKHYPLEYKLMGFAPEEWNNIKTALLLMYMADDLTGEVHDIPLSYYLKNLLTEEEIEFYFPEKILGSTPVIPTGTQYNNPSLNIPAIPAGDIWADIKIPEAPKDNTETGKGSNNWVVAGTRTKNGKPILCNDPHLALNLPALWYEVQLTAPGINVYGVSLPGAPGVVIGFNDKISWGFTNNYRDVKDYYAIETKNSDNYNFNGNAVAFEKRVEVIKIKGKPDFIDTVNYTIHGPVLYDNNFKEPNGIQQPLALKWMAHKESNELLSLYLLNRADDYDSYVNAIGYFLCPAQNFIYADVAGNIALWGQGQYINKWKGQGKYIMQGKDSSTLWGALIPVAENPHAVNPAQGYLSSANQNVSDSSYPYWYNGRFNEYRALRINEALDTIKDVTVADMFRLQNDEHSILARTILPYMLQVMQANNVIDDNLKELGQWNYNYQAESEMASVFQIWWSVLYPAIWADVFKKSPNGMLPLPERTVQIILNDKGRIQDVDKKIIASYKKAADSIGKLKQQSLQWYNVKNTSVTHLAKLTPFSYTGLKTGGWGNTVNAMKGSHGPSWRMVVQMNDVPEGYGVYPGGQSGNPGSKYYADFIDKWAKGEYYKLTFTGNGQAPAAATVKYTWHITKQQQ